VDLLLGDLLSSRLFRVILQSCVHERLLHLQCVGGLLVSGAKENVGRDSRLKCSISDRQLIYPSPSIIQLTFRVIVRLIGLSLGCRVIQLTISIKHHGDLVNECKYLFMVQEADMSVKYPVPFLTRKRMDVLFRFFIVMIYNISSALPVISGQTHVLDLCIPRNLVAPPFRQRQIRLH
jgi:hypothetical protein